MADIVVLNIGDSIAHGMGVAPNAIKNRYADLLCAEIAASHNTQLVDLSENGCTTSRALEKTEQYLQSAAFECARSSAKFIALIALGNVDAKMIPDPEKMICGIKPFKFLPHRYRGAQLDPRPYFSNRPVRRQLQMTESFFRSLLRLGLIKALGGVPIVARETSTKNMSRLINTLRNAMPDLKILIIGTFPIKHWAFHGSPESFQEFDQSNQQLAIGNIDKTHIIDSNEILLAKKPRIPVSCPDKFHLNERGHHSLFEHIRNILK